MAAGHQSEEAALGTVLAKGNELSRIDTAEDISPAERELLRLEKEINAELDTKLAAKGDSLLWPKACYFIVPNEFGERFAFYGVKFLFNKYIKYVLGQSGTTATIWTANFNALAYFSPLAGAAISDSFLGKYHTIVIMSVVYAIGMVLLAVLSIPGVVPLTDIVLGKEAFDPGALALPLWTWILPAMLVAVGTGGIKPCVSSHGGDQYLPHQQKGLDFFFSIFYVAINVGSLISGYATPYMKDDISCWGRHCYFAPYLMCAIVFIIAASVFAGGYKTYRIVPPRREFLPYKGVKTAVIAASRYLKADKAARAATTGWLDFAAPVVGQEFVEETRLIGRVIGMLLPITFFWMVYDQGQNEWQNQLGLMGPTHIPDEAFGNMNTIFVIIMVPSLAWFYRFLERRNIRFTVLQRMSTGFFIMLVAYICSGILQIIVVNRYDPVNYPKNENNLNGWWQTIPWFLLSLGESLISPEGLKLVYLNSGKQFRSQSASIWLAMSGFGNLITTAVNKALENDARFNERPDDTPRATIAKGISLPSKYWLFAALCAAANIWFIFWAKFMFTYKDAVGSMTAVPRKGEKASRAAALAKARQDAAEQGERTVYYNDVKGGDL